MTGELPRNEAASYEQMEFTPLDTREGTKTVVRIYLRFRSIQPPESIRDSVSLRAINNINKSWMTAVLTEVFKIPAEEIPSLVKELVREDLRWQSE